jgi:hypothetical protein
MKHFSLPALLAALSFDAPSSRRRFVVRKGFAQYKGAHTKKGHRKVGVQRRREAARLRAMTPLYPPVKGSRRFRFSSAEPGEWSAQHSLPTDEIKAQLQQAA